MVQRWTLTNYHDDTDTWTMPINPYEMSSPLADKNITVRQTVAATGFYVLMEGSQKPKEWTFRGSILDFDHFLELQRWFEKRHRVALRDHFNRWFSIYITGFAPIPKRRRNRYWSHDYEVTALVLSAQNAEILEANRDTILVGTDQ